LATLPVPLIILARVTAKPEGLRLWLKVLRSTWPRVISGSCDGGPISIVATLGTWVNRETNSRSLPDRTAGRAKTILFNRNVLTERSPVSFGAADEDEVSLVDPPWVQMNSLVP
jgi:hypothetical protein